MIGPKGLFGEEVYEKPGKRQENLGYIQESMRGMPHNGLRQRVRGSNGT